MWNGFPHLGACFSHRFWVKWQRMAQHQRRSHPFPPTHHLTTPAEPEQDALLPHNSFSHFISPTSPECWGRQSCCVHASREIHRGYLELGPGWILRQVGNEFPSQAHSCAISHLVKLSWHVFTEHQHWISQEKGSAYYFWTRTRRKWITLASDFFSIYCFLSFFVKSGSTCIFKIKATNQCFKLFIISPFTFVYTFNSDVAQAHSIRWLTMLNSLR